MRDDDSISSGSENGFGDFLAFCRNDSPAPSPRNGPAAPIPTKVMAHVVSNVSVPPPPVVTKVEPVKKSTTAEKVVDPADEDDTASVGSSSSGGDFDDFLAFCKAPSPASSPKTGPAAASVPKKVVIASPTASATKEAEESDYIGDVNAGPKAAPVRKAPTAVEAAPPAKATPAPVVVAPAAPASKPATYVASLDDGAAVRKALGKPSGAPSASSAAAKKRAPTPAKKAPSPAPAKKAAPPSPAKQRQSAMKKAAPTYVSSLSEDAAPSKAVASKADRPTKEGGEPLVRIDTAATAHPESSDSESDWSASAEEEAPVPETVVERRPFAPSGRAVRRASANVPMTKAESVGRGMALAAGDGDVASSEAAPPAVDASPGTEAEARAASAAAEREAARPGASSEAASSSAPSPAAPAVRRSTPEPAVRKRVPPEPKKFELPKSASAATLHFAREDEREAARIAAARSATRKSEPVVPLPVDHFTKLGEEQLAEKAREARELAESQMPAGIAYFTKKGKEDEAAHYAKVRELSMREMSVATRHFAEIDAERKAANEGAAGGETEIMPAAIQHFTLKDRELKERKRAEIRALHENPPPMAEGQAYFTNIMREEKERKRAEIMELKNNPPPASVATEYFKVKEAERKLEIEQMLQEPAPVAIEYFTQRARMEKEKSKRAIEVANSQPHEPAVATRHFAELDKKKAAGIEAARSQTHDKEPMVPLPIDHFTKLGEEQMAEKAREARELAESQMPAGIAYFTKKGEEDKAAHYARVKELSEAEMSVATRHFARIDAEKKQEEAAASLNGGGEKEIMPAAIQHFTLKDRELKEKKRAEIQALHENPPPMAEGQAYFTNKMREEQARKKAEIEELKKNPPPASVATEYFKVKEAERKVQIEQMLREPAPAAIEYFTQKAREEKEASRRALEVANSQPHEPAVATKHFAAMDVKKEEEQEKIRAEVRRKMMEPDQQRPSVNWATLTKQRAPVVPTY